MTLAALQPYESAVTVRRRRPAGPSHDVTLGRQQAGASATGLRSPSLAAYPPQAVLALQRSAGNAAVRRVLAASTARRPVVDGEELEVVDAVSAPGEPVAVTDVERTQGQETAKTFEDASVQRDDWAPRPEDVRVTIPVIQSPTSPAGTPNRIPPRVDTAVAVTIAGWHPPIAPIKFSVDGSGGTNGTATVNGGPEAELTANGTLQLRGGTQTSPGSAGNLRLVASVGSSRLAVSAPFTVAAIPQNFSVSRNSALTGAKRGVVSNNSWESDSGSTADLDEVERSEKVEYGAGSGIFAAGVNPANSGYRQATSPPIQDSHGVPTAAITGPGAISAQQVFVYKDKRTAVTDIPVRNSGFLITRTIVATGPGALQITTEKSGHGGTAKGFTSAAGSGSMSEPQAV